MCAPHTVADFRIVAWEKPHSLGDKMQSTASKIFAAQVFNTGFLVLILNADWTSLGLVGRPL
jgi:hypothetical protein